MISARIVRPMDAANVTLRKREPPRFPRPDPSADQVKFVGVFSARYGETPKSFAVVQLWLWQADGRMWGRYIRRNFPRGARSQFIHAHDAKVQCDSRDCRELTLSLEQDRPVKIARVSESAFQQDMGGREAVVILERGEIIPGFMLDLAPLTSESENTEWQKAVLQSITWDVPAT